MPDLRFKIVCTRPRCVDGFIDGINGKLIPCPACKGVGYLEESDDELADRYSVAARTGEFEQRPA
jgi:hypothetical protein